MPAYNEAEILEDSIREWHDEVIDKIPGSKIVVVNDASTDDTRSILDRLAAGLPGLCPIHSARNRGHGPSVRAGLDAVEADFAFQTDSDRQHLPSEFWLLWNEREGNDFIVGMRSSRADGAFRACISTAMRVANFLIWGKWIRDANCPFKLMRREPMREVLAKIPPESFIPMVHLSALIHKMNYRIREVPVTHLPRTGGTQSLQGLVKWAGISWRCLLEIIRVRASARNS